MKLSAIWAGLSLSSFLYQALTEQNWDRSVEVSYHAGITLLCVWLLMKVSGHEIRPASDTEAGR